MTDLEFSISQYPDGTLAGPERSALEERLATDAGATALLEEHRRLDELLRQAPLPAIQWDSLAQQLSAVIAEEAMPQAQEPAHTLRMPWVGFGSRIAIAASVLIAVGVTFAVLNREKGKSTSTTTSQTVAIQKPASFVEITGPSAEVASAPAAVEVSVGPSQAIAGESMLARYSDEVITRPSHVMVASGANPVQDTDTLAFDMQ
jgi:anti-sigma factor RsiW